MVSNPDIPLKKYKKIYEVSKDIMKELFLITPPSKFWKPRKR
jgi:hypothetical protein